MDNHLGHLPLSPLHFIVTVAINGAVVDAIVDSGGARSLIDSRTARLLGLTWEEAKNGEAGLFWGPGGEPTPYKGLVRGPVKLQFGQGVTVELDALRVIAHREPLVLLGGDFMAPRAGTAWRFQSLGIDAVRGGTMSFSRPARRRTVNMTERRFVRLTTWPLSQPTPTPPHTRERHPNARASPNPPPPAKVTFSEPEVPSISRETSSVDTRRLVALIKGRDGRCL